MIDIKGHEVYYRDKSVLFTGREFGIVELFVFNPGRVFSKEQIYERIWGLDSLGDVSNIPEHIKKICSKHNRVNPNDNYISTVWSIGYKWRNRVEKYNFNAV